VDPKKHPVKDIASVDANDEQIGPVLSGNAQDLAIRLAGGEYRIHGRGRTH